MAGFHDIALAIHNALVFILIIEVLVDPDELCVIVAIRLESAFGLARDLIGHIVKSDEVDVVDGSFASVVVSAGARRRGSGLTAGHAVIARFQVVASLVHEAFHTVDPRLARMGLHEPRIIVAFPDLCKETWITLLNKMFLGTHLLSMIVFLQNFELELEQIKTIIFYPF